MQLYEDTQKPLNEFEMRFWSTQRSPTLRSNYSQNDWYIGKKLFKTNFRDSSDVHFYANTTSTPLPSLINNTVPTEWNRKLVTLKDLVLPFILLCLVSYSSLRRISYSRGQFNINVPSLEKSNHIAFVTNTVVVTSLNTLQ